MICIEVFSFQLFVYQVNIGSDKGLVPSGTMPLSEPMLSKIHYFVIKDKELIDGTW